MQLDDLLVSYQQVQAPTIVQSNQELPMSKLDKLKQYIRNTQKPNEQNAQVSNQTETPLAFEGWSYTSSKKPNEQSSQVSTTTTSQVQTNPLKPGTRNDNAKYAFNYFVKNGLSRAAAAGIVGNLYWEDLGNPTRTVGDSRGTTAFGIAGFNSKGELPALQKFAKTNKMDINSIDTQLAYLTDVVKSGRVNLSDPNLTPEQASFIFGRDFEKFGGKTTNSKGHKIGYRVYEDPEHVRRRQTSRTLFNTYSA